LEIVESSNRDVRRATIIVLAMTLIAIVYLRWQGRVWWCQQGDLSPISIVVQSPHNSQHVFDAYSLSHLLHGLIFFGVFYVLRKRMSFGWRFVAATAVEIAWEVLENSPIIIERYRAGTVSFDYKGDSIINSLGDIVSYAIGFFIAWRVGLKWSIAIFLFVDLGMLWLIRDNLALNVLMLLWPIDAIRKWQAGG
jgi:hypothetical protein